MSEPLRFPLRLTLDELKHIEKAMKVRVKALLTREDGEAEAADELCERVRNAVRDARNMGSALKLCPGCRTFAIGDLFERVEAWPLAEVCSSCADEIRADDEDPREPECCASGCSVCTGERSYAGF